MFTVTDRLRQRSRTLAKNIRKRLPELWFLRQHTNLQFVFNIGLVTDVITLLKRENIHVFKFTLHIYWFLLITNVHDHACVSTLRKTFKRLPQLSPTQRSCHRGWYSTPLFVFPLSSQFLPTKMQVNAL